VLGPDEENDGVEGEEFFLTEELFQDDFA
jgi:hypothetical protein